MGSRTLCLLCVAAVIAVLYWRRPDAFYNPQFWAEDGSRFFSGVNFFGFETLVTPYAGYYHTLARLVALAGSLVPYRYVPNIYVFLSVCVILFILCYLFSQRFPWQNGIKFVIGLAIVATTVNNEVYMNLANWAFLLAPLWLLLAVSNEPSSRSQVAFDLVLVFIVGLSSPFSVCLWLAFLLRYIVRRTRHSAWLLAISLVVALIQVWNMPTRVQAGTALPVWNVLYVDAIIYRFGYMFLGEQIYRLQLTDTVRICGGIVVMSVYAWLLWHGIKRRNWTLVTMLGGNVLAGILSAYVMRNSLSGLARTSGRHFYVPAVTFAWALALSKPKRQLLKWLPLGMIWVAFLFLTPGSKNQVLPDLDWAIQVEACAGTSPVCRIPINPVTSPPVWYAALDARNYTIPTMQTEFRSTFEGKLELLGFDTSKNQAEFSLQLVWRTLSRMEEDYCLLVNLRDAEKPERVAVQVEIIPFEEQLYPTSVWNPKEILSLPVKLDLASVEPGRYQIGLSWCALQESENIPLAAFTATGESWKNNEVVLPLTLVVP